MREGQASFNKEWYRASFSEDRASLYAEKSGAVNAMLPMVIASDSTDNTAWFYHVPFSKVLLLTDKIRFFSDGRFTNEEDKTIKLTKEHLDALGFKV